MKRLLSFGFLLMGLSFTVTQSLLIRELLVAFYGNELSIGLVLGNWLILEALGSGLPGRLADRWGHKTSSFATLQVLFALFLPLCLVAALSVRMIVGAIPGEGVGLVPVFYSSLLILIPLALVDGAMFTFGCQAYAHLAGHQAPAIGWVYVLEAVGAIAGGIIFTYIFIPFLQSMQIVLLLSGLNLFSAALLLARSNSPPQKRRTLAPSLTGVLVLLIASFGLLISPLASEIQHWATRRSWGGHNLIYSENSVYGNVAVVQQESQYTFYADGIPILTAPVPDVASVEEMVHLPLLFVPQPRRALVLSGGVGGVLRELAKYPLTQIDYAELDPLLIKAVQRFPTPLTLSELGDPRVRVEYVDGRLLVRRKTWQSAHDPQTGYDLLIVNLPYPSTLQLNRFYTVEFFQMARELLAEEGIMVVGCPGTLTYMSDELRSLNSMIYHTLQQAFPYVRPIPGDVTLWLASSSDTLSTAQMETLIERWQARGLETRMMTASHIRLKFDPRRLDWFQTSLDSKGKIAVNRDLHPTGLFYGLFYWNALFSPDLARVFALADRLNLLTLSLPIIGCALLFLIATRLIPRARKVIVPMVITTTGFTGMTADLLMVFAFQTLYGYVYHWIGLLITAFMAGLSLGGLFMTRRLDTLARKSTLFRLEMALVLYGVFLPIALSILTWRINDPVVFTLIQGGFLGLNALAGLLVGAQFPIANRMWLKDRENQPAAAGVLYACDLAGAFVSSIVAAVILIPVLGILETCVLTALLKLSSLMLIAALPSSSPQ